MPCHRPSLGSTRRTPTAPFRIQRTLHQIKQSLYFHRALAVRPAVGRQAAGKLRPDYLQRYGSHEKRATPAGTTETPPQQLAALEPALEQLAPRPACWRLDVLITSVVNGCLA